MVAYAPIYVIIAFRYHAAREKKNLLLQYQLSKNHIFLADTIFA